MKLSELKSALADLEKASRLRLPDDGLERARLESQFGADFIDAASNDYLDLARFSGSVSRGTSDPSSQNDGSHKVEGAPPEEPEFEQQTSQLGGISRETGDALPRNESGALLEEEVDEQRRGGQAPFEQGVGKGSPVDAASNQEAERLGGVFRGAGGACFQSERCETSNGGAMQEQPASGLGGSSHGTAETSLQQDLRELPQEEAREQATNFGNVSRGTGERSPRNDSQALSRGRARGQSSLGPGDIPRGNLPGSLEEEAFLQTTETSGEPEAVGFEAPQSVHRGDSDGHGRAREAGSSEGSSGAQEVRGEKSSLRQLEDKNVETEQTRAWMERNLVSAPPSHRANSFSSVSRETKTIESSSSRASLQTLTASSLLEDELSRSLDFPSPPMPGVEPSDPFPSAGASDAQASALEVSKSEVSRLVSQTEPGVSQGSASFSSLSSEAEISEREASPFSPPGANQTAASPPSPFLETGAGFNTGSDAVRSSSSSLPPPTTTSTQSASPFERSHQQVHIGSPQSSPGASLMQGNSRASSHGEASSELSPTDPEAACSQTGGNTQEDEASSNKAYTAALISLSVSRETELGTRQGAPLATGAGSSRLIFGSAPQHLLLEEELAEWVGQPSALLFASGYAANVGALGALLSPEDAVFSDSLNHASLIDGIRLSRAKARVFPHLHLAALEEGLQGSLEARARWVVCESYYSMDGDGPDLAALRALCDSYDAHLYIDEAHSLGTFGPRGAGLCAQAGVKADVLMAAFGKSVDSQGACVAGSKELRTWLWNRARSFVFSTAPSPLLAEATRQQIVRTQAAEQKRTRLEEICQRLRSGLLEAGAPLVRDSFGPVVGLLLGEEEKAMLLAGRLRKSGILAQAIRPPTVPEGASRVRLVLRSSFSDSQIDRLVRAVADECAKLQ